MKELFNLLLKNKVHIGHSPLNTNLLASWFLFRLTELYWYINIYKTIWFLKFILKFIKYIVNNNKPIWFINMDISNQAIIGKYSQECGEFYCSNIWKRGFISNFFSMSKIVKKYLQKPEIYGDYKLYNFYKKWYMTRYTWPRAIFVSNMDNNNIVCKEAVSMFVPIIGLIDSNIKHHYYNLPIPSNDDSLNSILYWYSLISSNIMLNKYKKLILWVIYYRNKLRSKSILNFFDSLKEHMEYRNIKIMKRKTFLFNRLNLFNIIDKGVNFLFLHRLKEKKLIFKDNSEHSLLNIKIYKKFEFFELLIKSSLYKNKIIQRNRGRIKNIKNGRRFFVNMNRIERLKKRYFYWFYFLLNMRNSKNYKIILESFVSNVFFSISSVVMLETYKFRKYKFKYLLVNLFKHKDSWRWRDYKYVKFFNYFFLICNRPYLSYDIILKQMYLNVFISFLFNNYKNDEYLYINRY